MPPVDQLMVSRSKNAVQEVQLVLEDKIEVGCNLEVTRKLHTDCEEVYCASNLLTMLGM